MLFPAAPAIPATPATSANCAASCFCYSSPATPLLLLLSCYSCCSCYSCHACYSCSAAAGTAPPPLAVLQPCALHVGRSGSRKQASNGWCWLPSPYLLAFLPRACQKAHSPGFEPATFGLWGRRLSLQAAGALTRRCCVSSPALAKRPKKAGLTPAGPKPTSSLGAPLSTPLLSSPLLSSPLLSSPLPSSPLLSSPLLSSPLLSSPLLQETAKPFPQRFMASFWSWGAKQPVSSLELAWLASRNSQAFSARVHGKSLELSFGGNRSLAKQPVSSLELVWLASRNSQTFSARVHGKSLELSFGGNRSLAKQPVSSLEPAWFASRSSQTFRARVRGKSLGLSLGETESWPTNLFQAWKLYGMPQEVARPSLEFGIELGKKLAKQPVSSLCFLCKGSLQKFGFEFFGKSSPVAAWKIFKTFVGMVLNCGLLFFEEAWMLVASCSFGIELVPIQISFQKQFKSLNFFQNQKLPKVADFLFRPI